ncbi:hypothetical protein ACFWBH_03650 [Streptomyces sp. NPDC059999]|uniref:hypothetical protein n=1 Tax=Streptomyces sp. NPDC059999 TaxID=3347030 RepID=UPI0036B4D194
MDSKATLLILGWGGVISVLLFVLQGLIKQFHDLLISLRPILQSARKWARSRRRAKATSLQAPTQRNAELHIPAPAAPPADGTVHRVAEGRENAANYHE